MKKNNFSRLFAAMLFVAVFVLAGCKPEPNYISSLKGEWASQYDGYTINSDTIVYDDGGYGYGWTREIVEVSDEYIYSKDSDGKYYTTAYKNLTDDACEFSNAYKADGKSNAASLDEAKEEFTVANKYFAIYGKYSKK